MVMVVLDTATTLPVNSDVCARAIWLARVAVSKRRSKDLVFISQLKAAQLETTSRCCGLMLREICPHLNPLPKGEEATSRHHSHRITTSWSFDLVRNNNRLP